MRSPLLPQHNDRVRAPIQQEIRIAGGSQILNRFSCRPTSGLMSLLRVGGAPTPGTMITFESPRQTAEDALDSRLQLDPLARLIDRRDRGLSPLQRSTPRQIVLALPELLNSVS